MQTIAHNDDERKSAQEVLSDLFPSIPPDPLIEIGKHVKEGFDYARHCLKQNNRLRKRVGKLEQVVVDLQSRQEYLENLVIRKDMA